MGMQSLYPEAREQATIFDNNKNLIAALSEAYEEGGGKIWHDNDLRRRFCLGSGEIASGEATSLLLRI